MNQADAGQRKWGTDIDYESPNVGIVGSAYHKKNE